jgi:Uma2 family endonuclease
MSTITPTMPVPAMPGGPVVAPHPVPISGDDRYVFRVRWEIYDALSEALTEGQHVRLAYDGRDLEFMTTGNVHENVKEVIGRFISTVAASLRIKFKSFGEATWKSANAERGLQADLSYCFDPEKIRVAKEALSRRSTDRADYPKPDLAVEIDISPSQVDRPLIYAVLNVAEVWRFNGRTLIIDHLQPDGSYVQVKASRFLGISADDIERWLTADDVSDEDAWLRRLQEWVARGMNNPDGPEGQTLGPEGHGT